MVQQQGANKQTVIRRREVEDTIPVRRGGPPSNYSHNSIAGNSLINFLIPS
jgi:hypothetical protein